MRLFPSFQLCLAFLAIGSGCVRMARAVPITDVADLTTSTTLIDFSRLVDPAREYYGVTGPVQIGNLAAGLDVTASSTTDDLYLKFNGTWGLIGNGTWDSTRKGYIGTFSADGTIRIAFNTPSLISGFGAFMNYADAPEYLGVPVVMRAYGEDGTLLEEFFISDTAPIDTASNSLNAGAFRGIQRSSFDIKYVEITGRRVVLDDLVFLHNQTLVPRPPRVPELGATGLLLALGLAALGWWRRRQPLT